MKFNYIEKDTKFKIGDTVAKVRGDYTYEGIVVSIFEKLTGKIRVVVEDDRGLLFIFNEDSLQKILPLIDVVE